MPSLITCGSGIAKRVGEAVAALAAAALALFLLLEPSHHQFPFGIVEPSGRGRTIGEKIQRNHPGEERGDAFQQEEPLPRRQMPRAAHARQNPSGYRPGDYAR
jgi:hypothetical protein